MQNENLDHAISILKSGGIVVIPTETAYGLAADATNSLAVERVQQLKGRESWKTPPLIVASIEMAERYLAITPKMRELVETYWPGPLTIVGKANDSGLSKNVVREDGTIAVRVSSNEIAREISNALNVPIIATSANLSGQSECYSVDEVQKQFEAQSNQPDFFLDVGTLPHESPSTIIKEEDGKIVIIRQGSIIVF